MGAWSGLPLCVRSMEGLGVTCRGAGRSVTKRANPPLRCDLDVFDLACAVGNWHSVFAQTLQMEDDCSSDLGLDFGNGGARRYAPRKVGDVRRVVACGLFNDDGVAHMTSRLQTSLLLNTVHCSGCQIVARLTGNGDATRLARVLELAMTSTSCDQVPTIGLEHPQNFADLHEGRIAGLSRQALRVLL